MHRIEGAETVQVRNMRTGEVLSYVGITPENAVVSAHARSLGVNVFDAEERFAAQRKISGSTVFCGDFAALTEEGKKALLERKARRAEEISKKTGESVVYHYGTDTFRRDPVPDSNETATPAYGG